MNGLELGTVWIDEVVDWEDLTPPCRYYACNGARAEWIGKTVCCGKETFMCGPHMEVMVKEGARGRIECSNCGVVTTQTWELL